MEGLIERGLIREGELIELLRYLGVILPHQGLKVELRSRCNFVPSLKKIKNRQDLLC